MELQRIVATDSEAADVMLEVEELNKMTGIVLVHDLQRPKG